MTKGQKTAVDYIDNFISSSKKSFSWKSISEEVENSGAKVKNWLSIRGVLQYYERNNLIKRSDDLFVEEYVKL